MKNHRILVVDDEPASRTGLQELLTLWEYEVAAAADGQEALERAGASTPDLVIADLVMPGIDGLELLSRRRRDAPTTAVVFLTGRAVSRLPCRQSRTAPTTTSPSLLTRRAFSCCSTARSSAPRPRVKLGCCGASSDSVVPLADSWAARTA